MISTLQSRAMVMTLCLLACVVAWLGFAAGCEKKAPPAAGGAKMVRVVTTTAHMAELVRMAAGDLVGKTVTVESIMGEGIDPHTYKLTRSDAVLLDGADIVIASGLHLEGKLDDTLAALKSGKRRVVVVGDSLPKKGLLEHEGAADPHFWMDIGLYALGLQTVADALALEAGIYPQERADDRRQEAAKYTSAAMDLMKQWRAYAKQAIESVPEQQRVLVTSHDAFAYLGRSVGLQVHAIQGISTESEASVRDIEALAQMLAEKEVPAVFIESSVPRRTIDALIAATKARGHEVKIGGELFSDALGKPGTYEGTYIGMMDHNITTIVRGLGGTVPERGMSGKLAVPAAR